MVHKGDDNYLREKGAERQSAVVELFLGGNHRDRGESAPVRRHEGLEEHGSYVLLLY